MAGPIFSLLTVLVVVTIVTIPGVCARWNNMQRLNRFQKKYNNSQSDIVFLLDVSGSVSNYGFSKEKEFIKSLLNYASVQPFATRVSVVTFGKYVREEIDYVDYKGADKDKCTFNTEFARVKHRYGRATNINGAFKQAKSILQGSKDKGVKRDNVNTAVVLLTDGQANMGESWWDTATKTAKKLRDRSTYDAEIFSVGVGWVNQRKLTDYAGSDENVIIARNFNEFADLATRIRGG